MTKKKNWETYEAAARKVIEVLKDEFGIDFVEDKQKVPGLETGTNWEIDGKGIFDSAGEAFIIIECKRHTKSRISQEVVGGLVFRIQDTGASSGIIVSHKGLQKGAQLVASAKNVHDLVLDKDSDPVNYVAKYLNTHFIGVGLSGGSTVTATIEKVINKSPLN